MDCIECHSEMDLVQREGIEIDVCSNGHGVWLDSGELKLMVDSMVEPRSEVEHASALGPRGAEPDPGAATAAAARQCPRCSTVMERVNYDMSSGVYIDTCAEHGVWCDPGELERLEAWIEANRERMQPLEAALNSVPDQMAARDKLWVETQQNKGDGRFGSIAATFAYWRALRRS